MLYQSAGALISAISLALRIVLLFCTRLPALVSTSISGHSHAGKEITPHWCKEYQVCGGNRIRAVLSTASPTYCLTPVRLMCLVVYEPYTRADPHSGSLLGIWLLLTILISIPCCRKSGSFLNRHIECICFSLQTHCLKSVSVLPSPALSFLPLLTIEFSISFNAKCNLVSCTELH